MSQITDTDIQDRICKVLADVLKVKPDQVRPESRYREDLGADSLDNATLLMALEEEFGREITDEEAESLTTVGNTVAFVKSKLAGGG